MKQLIFALLFLSSVVSADSMNMSPVISVNHKITNIDSYSDIVLLDCSFYDHMGADLALSCHKLSADGMIYGGRRPNSETTRLLAVPKTAYEQGNLKDILKHYTFKREYSYSLHTYINPVFQKSIPLIELINYTDGHGTDGHGKDLNYTENNETRFYSITSVTDSNVTLKLDKRLIEFKDGSTKTIRY